MLNLFEAIKNTPSYFKQLACKDLLFTQYDCPQIETKAGLFTQCNYIAYVISGKRKLHKPGKTWDLSEGVAVFVKKGAYIAERGPNDGWCVMVFFIPDNYLRQFVKDYRANLPLKSLPSPPTDQVIDIEVNETTRSFFFSMLPYFTHDPPPPESLLELKFRELVFNILINPANKNVLSYVNHISDIEKTALTEIMEANYTYNLSLNDYAKLAHRSLATFKREFTEVFHTTPGKWLLQKRINYAKLLLNTSSKSVADICYESGFENATHFSRVFKEITGSSPLQFRKAIVVS